VRHGARQTGKINKLKKERKKERKNKKREHAAESGTGVELKKFLGNLFGSRSQEGECDGLDGESGGGRGWRGGEVQDFCPQCSFEWGTSTSSSSSSRSKETRQKRTK
jgi:hypothetical protein